MASVVREHGGRGDQTPASPPARPCAVCTFADANGWTGLPTGTAHCRKCHKEWTGVRAAHCPMCCRTFTSDSAAQLHKRSEGPRLVCVPPETVLDEWDRPLFRPSDTAGAEWALADLPKMVETDDEFGLTLDPCEHPSINGTTCASCGSPSAVGAQEGEQ
jgi:hypothetical protein